MLLLEGRVQHYEWGGYAFIPALLGRRGKARKPHAEYWLGSHPNGSAIARGEGGRVPLIEIAPDLPYLLKVLDARQMLSIQTHPNRAQARRGFAAENAAGIPLNAPTRNYKDANHKPEVHVALTPFWMLNGFRPWPQIVEILDAVPEFRPLRSAKSLRALVRRILTLPEPTRILEPLLARLRSEGAVSRQDPGYWVLRAAETFPSAAQDRGIFFLYLLNLVALQPGQGTYQPAGVLHAYLEGSTVELMANSDNVLRAGLTSKHVDTRELLRTISYAGEAPPILKGEPAGRGIRVYRTPSTEFELTRIHLSVASTRRRVALGPVILLLTEGEARIGGIPLHRGQAVFARDEAYAIEAGPSKVEIFQASVPAR
ncbi:MAG: mannose-6-phosphate isomerase, class I [Bryobacterales bacterium]|nr:mannose-6-phosphate isomerase, class I [Bryobacterales bacterium]